MKLTVELVPETSWYSNLRKAMLQAEWDKLCDMCHHVKHIGLVGILAGEGKLDYDEAVEHFMKTNGCDRGAFEEHRSAGFKVWRRRPRHRWTLDLGKYEHLVNPARKPSPSSEEEIAFQNILELREEIKIQRD